jgi:hypothetical protein
LPRAWGIRDPEPEVHPADVKEFVSAISETDNHSRNTVRLILTTLRAVLSAAVEDNLIGSNPASKVGKFNKRERGESKAQAMTLSEAQAFLSAAVEVCPDIIPCSLLLFDPDSVKAN